MVMPVADGKIICLMSCGMASIRGMLLNPMEQRNHIATGLYIHIKMEGKYDVNKYVEF